MSIIAKQPISLCLHDIQDIGTTDSSITMSLLSVPFSREDTEPPLVCEYSYYDADDAKITTEIDHYEYVHKYGHSIPISSWNHGKEVYYLVSGHKAAIACPIFCPPLLCRSDNGAVIVVEDELPLAMKLNHADYNVHIFTNVTPNENGCLTLDISLEKKPIAGLVATVFYYVPNIVGLENKVVSQSFPAYYLQNRRFRLGFKTFYNPENADFCAVTLPMVWVTFALELQGDKERG
jgi:hypothetical protein